MAEVRLSVVIPACNEETRLPRTLQAIDAYLKKQSYHYEILVVDDGSRDRTRERAENLVGEIQRLRVIGERENHGKGYAVRKGMLAAKGEYRLFTDADNSTSIDHVELMWPEFERGGEVVIGSRDIKGAVIAVRQSWWRERLGDIFNLMVQILAGVWGVWDTQCGFKGFSAKAAEEIFSRTTINRWAFDVEVLVVAKELGYGIKEVPVTWRNDKESKVKFLGMVEMLWEVVQITFNNMRSLYDERKNSL